MFISNNALLNPQQYITQSSDDNGMDTLSSKPAELDPSDLVSNKIHVRGVDDLTTDDVLNYIESYHSSIEPQPQIEWIDDTSANILLEDASIAASVLSSLSEDSSSHLSHFQLRKAKIFLAHPESNLQLRIAVSTDRKQPRAYESSRFYMMHPEHDPREKKRSERRSSYPRVTRYGDQVHRRRQRNDERQGLSASMNGDSASPRDSRRNSVSSYSSTNSRSRRGSRHVDRRVPCRRRDRSASPNQHDGRCEYRSRGYTPPPRYRKRDPNPFPTANGGKELFPVKTAPRFGQRIAARSESVHGKELLTNKGIAANIKKELFPLKSGVNGHRRSLAFDAADETADIFATGMTVPFTDGSADQVRRSAKGNLADRITFGPAAHLGLSKLTAKDSGFSIQGAATKSQNAGFSIRGLAADGPGSSGARVTELFPTKAGVGNSGKELFAAKLAGGSRRKRAVDMFAD